MTFQAYSIKKKAHHLLNLDFQIKFPKLSKSFAPSEKQRWKYTWHTCLNQRSWGSHAWLRSFSPRSWYCLLRSRSSWIVKQWKPQVHSSLGSKFTKYQHVLPRSLTQSLNNDGWEMSFLLGSCTFRGHVKLQEGNHVQPPTRNEKKCQQKKHHPNLYLRNLNPEHPHVAEAWVFVRKRQPGPGKVDFTASKKKTMETFLDPRVSWKEWWIGHGGFLMIYWIGFVVGSSGFGNMEKGDVCCSNSPKIGRTEV